MKLKSAVAILTLAFGQLVFAQSDAKAVAQKPGQINTIRDLDLGTFSEQYDLQAGKRSKFEVVMNKKNFWVDALFGGIPVSAMFNDKGKTASLKFDLVNVSDEPQK